MNTSTVRYYSYFGRRLARIAAVGGTLATVGAAQPAWADYVGLSGGVSRSPGTASFPSSGSNSFALSGSYDLSDQWNFGLSLGLTQPKPVPDTSDTFVGKTKDGSTFSAGLGATWLPGFGWNADEHWSFDFGFGLSPKSTDVSSTTIAFEVATPKGTTTDDSDALLKSTSTSQDLTLGLNYDSNGDSNLEWSLSLGLWPNRLTSTQTVEEIVSPQGKVQTRDQLLAMCQKQPLPKLSVKPCKRLTPLLNAQAATIVTLPVVVGLSATVFANTTVNVGFTYYIYSADPNSVGYFTLAAQGKQSKLGPSASFGSGIAVSPYVYGSSLSVAHKLGPVRLTAGGGYSVYLDDAGHNTSAALKAAWKITDNWRVNFSYGQQWDTDSDGDVSNSWSASGGLRYTFSKAPEPDDDDAGSSAPDAPAADKPAADSPADAAPAKPADKPEEKPADKPAAEPEPKGSDKPVEPKPETPPSAPAPETPKF
ncbi:MAG: hypothetical protein EXR77_07520 [Myxococcales bacterium]|nr:hypothetical protein [Myxococcales bacterium]